MGIRSLFAGVSGLRNFQQQLDVIGNNIANSQTSGYKYQRVTFADLLSQTAQGATGPNANGTVGGTNAKQFGLGSQIGSIDTDMGQGNLLSTGRTLDVAISGNGFFQLSNGSDTFYTRNGAFDIDATGNLVSTTNGYVVQGYSATQGLLDTSASTNIQIPTETLPAEPTSTVSLVGNLDNSAQQIGTVRNSQQLLATELNGHDTDMDGLFAVGTLGGRVGGLQAGVTTATITLTGATSSTDTFTYVSNDGGVNNDFNSLEDLVAEIDDHLGANWTVTHTAAGQIQLTKGGAAGNVVVAMSSNNSSLLTSLSNLNQTYNSGGPTVTSTSDQYCHDAETSDLLTNVRNSTGTSIAPGGNITINGDVGNTSVNPAGTYTYNALTSTLGQLCSQIDTTLSIDNSTGTALANGQIRISGDGGTDYSISNVRLSSTNAAFNTVFNDENNWSISQQAQDNHTTSFIAYDSLGAKHTVTVKMNIREPQGGFVNWEYNISSVTTETGAIDTVTPALNTGDGYDLLFNSDGSYENMAESQITISPGGGSSADQLVLILNPGTEDGYDGLVSFENDSSARFTDLTGFASGELQNINVGTDGVISGNFTNGQNMTLAQIRLATFENPAGLEKAGSNMYNETLNSGNPTETTPTQGGAGSLIASTLEGSNVDIAQEFIYLITAQRGFQTNSRIISTANDIMSELVNLVR